MASQAPSQATPSTLLTRSVSRAQAISHRIDRHPAIAFAALTAFYLLVVTCLSYLKLLWLDELITLHIARLNSVKAIWNALAVGVDPNPPMIHLTVMLCRRLFGEHALALRLPAILGFWLGTLALFLFLKRRLPPTWALTGAILTFGMDGFGWSYESRSYAIFYGFTMLALYCWTLASDPHRTSIHCFAMTLAMALSLAAALCTNYFSVLAFFPIAAAELTQTIQRTRRTGTLAPHIRWTIWLALAVAASPLLIFHSFIKISVALYEPYAWNKVSTDAIFNSYQEMIGFTLYPVAALILLALAVWWLAPIAASVRGLRPRWLGTLAASHYHGVTPQNPLTAPETAAVAVLAAYPFVGYLVASIRGGMLSPRFVLPVCLGCAAAACVLAFRLFGHLRSAATYALLCGVLWLAGREAVLGYSLEVEKESFFRVISHIPEIMRPGQPLVVADNLLVLPLRFYAPPQIASRIVFPVDFPAILRRRGEASGEINLWTGRHLIYDLPIIPLAVLQQGTGLYPIITGDPDWIVGDLRQHLYRSDPLMVDSEAAGMVLPTISLSHGKPYFYWADRQGITPPALPVIPIPFDLQDNMPSYGPKDKRAAMDTPIPFR